jgi:transketolase
MKAAFFQTLLEVAAADPSVNLAVGDLGFNAIELFAARFPDRFLNVGVAEQNLAGIAAGLALTGRTVFIYSIGNFPTLRCLEQVRNDICYHGANVKIVSNGGGYGYGSLGMSHHNTEDLAILRALPGMTVVAPADTHEAAEATRALAARPGPAYLRLGSPARNAPPASQPFEIGKAIRVQEGSDVTMISTGGCLSLALEAAALLRPEGVSTRVLSMHTIKPLDIEAVRRAATETRGVFTIEEHSILGGLGGAVAEVLAELNARAVFRRFGLPDSYAATAGSQQYLRAQAGLTPGAIAGGISSALRTATQLT